MTVTFDNEEQALNWAIKLIQEHGGSVRLGTGREVLSVGKLRKRVAPHLAASTFTQRLKHPDCPRYEGAISESGRILCLVPNPALLDWLTEPAHAGLKHRPPKH